MVHNLISLLLRCCLRSCNCSQMDDGTYQGCGKATFLNGHVYQGEFDTGMMHGQGVLTWPDGTVSVARF